MKFGNVVIDDSLWAFLQEQKSKFWPVLDLAKHVKVPMTIFLPKPVAEPVIPGGTVEEYNSALPELLEQERLSFRERSKRVLQERFASSCDLGEHLIPDDNIDQLRAEFHLSDSVLTAVRGCITAGLPGTLFLHSWESSVTRVEFRVRWDRAPEAEL